MSNKWHNRFIELAQHAAQWSLDPSTKVGAIIVDREKNVRSIGYNGFPRNVEDSEERLNDRETKYKMVVHAEANAIATCARLGVRADGCTMYCTHFPCSTCCGIIIQAGIKKLYVPMPETDFLERWEADYKTSRVLLEEADIEIWVMP